MRSSRPPQRVACALHSKRGRICVNASSAVTRRACVTNLSRVLSSPLFSTSKMQLLPLIAASPDLLHSSRNGAARSAPWRLEEDSWISMCSAVINELNAWVACGDAKKEHRPPWPWHQHVKYPFFKTSTHLHIWAAMKFYDPVGLRVDSPAYDELVSRAAATGAPKKLQKQLSSIRDDMVLGVCAPDRCAIALSPLSPLPALCHRTSLMAPPRSRLCLAVCIPHGCARVAAAYGSRGFVSDFTYNVCKLRTSLSVRLVLLSRARCMVRTLCAALHVYCMYAPIAAAS